VYSHVVDTLFVVAVGVARAWVWILKLVVSLRLLSPHVHECRRPSRFVLPLIYIQETKPLHRSFVPLFFFSFSVLSTCSVLILFLGKQTYIYIYRWIDVENRNERKRKRSIGLSVCLFLALPARNVSSVTHHNSKEQQKEYF
jgi:hypothetical protein